LKAVFPMDYDKLLSRAFSALPENTSSGERFETPTAALMIQGNKTVVVNFSDICSTLRRTPEEISKYLFKELAAPGEMQAGRLVLVGKFSDRVVNERVASYTAQAVVCKECGKPDTHIESVERNLKVLVCEACGAKSPVRL